MAGDARYQRPRWLLIGPPLVHYSVGYCIRIAEIVENLDQVLFLRVTWYRGSIFTRTSPTLRCSSCSVLSC